MTEIVCETETGKKHTQPDTQTHAQNSLKKNQNIKNFHQYTQTQSQ